MKIALDALGGDYGVKPNVLGAIKATKDFGCDVILVGDETKIQEELKQNSYDPARITVVHAPDMIDMEASPALEYRRKKNASIVVCAKLVKEGKADVMISAGNSGATMVAALFGLGRIKGVDRPAIASPMPTQTGFALIVDAGANADCKAVNLLQFAVLGSVYFKHTQGKPNATVGLLSIGEEEGKGNLLIKETTKHIRKLGLNYYGNIEGRDIHTGMIDIIVCDGFVGNIVLKTSEGLAKSLFKMIKSNLKGKYFAMFGMLMAKSALMGVKKVTDPDTVGGAPLLGVNGNVIISHGKSNEKAIYHAIKAGIKTVESKTLKAMEQAIADHKAIFDEAEGK